MRRTPEGYPFIGLHYSANEDLTPQKIKILRDGFTAERHWQREMEINVNGLTAIEDAEIKPHLKREARYVLRLNQEMEKQRAINDCRYWILNCTKTQDEQDPVDPFKPFPDRRYFGPIFDVMENESPVFIYKSRTMMETWQVCAWTAHFCFTHPGMKAVFQSEDEDRAVHCVECCKILWENSLDVLKASWPLKKSLEKQAYNRLEMANKSEFSGIPGNPNKVRSEHPTIFVMDEAAIIAQGEESWNTAQGARCPKMVALSSAYPGWMQDVYDTTVPVDWPEYEKAE